jgi:ketopantoate reductase
MITRTKNWHFLQQPPGRPILVAVRNEHLADVMVRVPPHRHEDLVFIQNGMLRPFLQRFGVPHATRGLLYFAVQKRGDVPKPGGKSPFSGPRAANVVAWMQSCKIPAEEVSPDGFAKLELEKLSWNCAFGLMCQVHEVTVGEVATKHGRELGDLIREFGAVGRAALKVKVSDKDLLRRQVAYARSISAYRGSVKDWEWRNGWFVKQALATGIETPVHFRLLEQIGWTPSAG